MQASKTPSQLKAFTCMNLTHAAKSQQLEMQSSTANLNFVAANNDSLLLIMHQGAMHMLSSF